MSRFFDLFQSAIVVKLKACDAARATGVEHIDPVLQLRHCNRLAAAGRNFIDQKDRVNQPAVQTIINNEDLFPGRVVRGPTVNGQLGDIRSVDISYLNFGALHAAGLDYEVSYKVHTMAGDLAPHLAATEIYRYEAAVTPQAPLQDRLSKGNTDAWAPRWKGTASLGWSLQDYSATISANYVSSYQDYSRLPTGQYLQLGNFWRANLYSKKEFTNPFGGFGHAPKAGYVALGVNNLFDRMPRFSAGGGFGLLGYDPSEYDILGRFIYINAGVRW